MNTINMNDVAAQVKQFITGANKHLSTGIQQIQVGGATFTVTVSGVTQAEGRGSGSAHVF
jgi:hypothetical protein